MRLEAGTRFDSTPYFKAHGRHPRGRGLWCFSTRSKPSHDDQVYFSEGTLTKAKLDALDRFSGAIRIFVLP